MLDWMKAAKTVAQDPEMGFDPNAVTRSETVTIHAPARLVWQILTDLPRYNEWNPFCIRAVSTLEMGAPVEMTLINYATAGGPTVPNLEYICGFEPERLLSWEFPNLDYWPYTHPAKVETDRAKKRGSSANRIVIGMHIFAIYGEGTDHWKVAFSCWPVDVDRNGSAIAHGQDVVLLNPDTGWERQDLNVIVADTG